MNSLLKGKNTFLLVFFAGCAIFKSAPSTDDPLLNFYESEPPAYTKASLRLTEKAREQIQGAQYTSAMDTLNKALSLDPQNPFTYYFLALGYHQKSEYKKSNNFLEKAKQLFLSFPYWKAESYRLAGLNWEKLGNAAMARKNFKKAKAIYPDL